MMSCVDLAEASRLSAPPAASSRPRKPASPRAEVFVTNAVKHVQHEIRGKRRLHKRPSIYEIERCKIWLASSGRS